MAIRTIRDSAILSGEARMARPALRQEALKPATQDEIRAIIGPRFALFPQPQRTDGEWAAWWAEYFDALEGLTPYAVEAGMAAWVKSPEAEFMAKPGKLRELATTTPNNNRWAKAHMRAQKATAIDEAKTVAPQDRIPPEQFKAMMADTLAKLEAKQPPPARRQHARPTPSAPVDERGVSDAARALLERQRGAQPHA